MFVTEYSSLSVLENLPLYVRLPAWLLNIPDTDIRHSRSFSVREHLLHEAHGHIHEKARFSHHAQWVFRLIRFLGCHASFVEYTGPHHCADSSVSVSSAIPTSPHVAEADNVVLGSSFVEPSSVSNFVLSVNQKYIHVLPSRKAVPQIGSFCGEAHYFGLFTPLLIDITRTRRFCHSANAVS